MSEVLNQFRAKYPIYKDVSDADLADGIYNKFYAGKVDRATFDEKLGLSQPMTWGDAASDAVGNIPESAAQFGKDIAQPFLHPIETAKTLADLGKGILEKIIPGEQGWDEATADAVGKFFVDRYGSVEGIKNTLAKDPVGMLADVATVLTGGGAAAARAPGVAGRIANAASKAGRVIDPMNAAVKGAGAVGRKVVGPTAAAGLGMTTGVGSMPVKEAAKAGYRGGEYGRAFQSQLRGTAPVEEIVTDARNAVAKMRKQRGQQYRQGMAGVAADDAVLGFDDIDKAVNDVADVGSFKGESIRPKTSAAFDEIRQAVDDWKNLDPADYHTAEGLDALKQKLYDIGKGYDPVTQSQARMVADQIYNSVKDTIQNQAPQYADVMRGYGDASTLIDDIDKTLKTGRKANVDQAARALQSVMRNNANTNYGRRVSLAEALADSGAPNLMPKIAGQSMSSPTPRSLAGAASLPTAAAVYAFNPHLLPALAAQSPRVVGEAAYYAGKSMGPTRSLAARLNPDAVLMAGQEAFQIGRLQDDERRRLATQLLGSSN